jgi:2-methylisocitrate lyase-like PEP mutase family enzyme
MKTRFIQAPSRSLRLVQDVSCRYREAKREDAVRATVKLRALLNSGQITVAPGAYDGLSARMVEQAGFPAIYASGGAIARSAGLPDLGLLSVTAIADRYA